MSSLGLFTLFFSQLRYSRGIVARPGGAPSKPTRSLVKSRLSIRSLVLPEIADQIVGGTVMRQRWFRFALDLRNDPLRQHFPQLDAPLIKRVDAPDRALGKNGVFVKSDQRAEDFRCQALCQNRVRRTIALKHAVGNQPLGRSFRLHLLRSLAERQGLGLRTDIGNQHVVVPAQWIERLGKTDEVAGNQPRSLMDQLVEGVLTVGSRLAPVNRTG